MSDTALLEKLKRFRNDPSAARPADADALMSQCFTLLSTAKSLHQHWFCGEASESLREAATFLIRLHAYDSSAVPAWKEQCAKVIHGCCACNSSYQDAKLISRTTYLSEYGDESLDAFFATIDNWELDIIKAALPKSGPWPSHAIPAPIVFHILANVNILKDSTMMSSITSLSLENYMSGWPPGIPPGLLVLFCDSNPGTRDWAKAASSLCTLADDIDPHGLFAATLTQLIDFLAASPRLILSQSASFFLPSTICSADLWTALPGIISLMSPRALQTFTRLPKPGLIRVILSHLSDTNDHFFTVLECFTTLLDVLHSTIWNAEAPDYPQVVFDTIKDNQAMVSLLRGETQDSTNDQAFDWLKVFVPLVRSSCTPQVFGNVAAKCFVYLGEELRHPGHSVKIQALASDTLFRIMHDVHVLAQEGKAIDPDPTNASSKPTHASVLCHTFETHAPIITNVAFAEKDDAWDSPRQSAHALLALIFRTDYDRVQVSLFGLSKQLEIRAREVKEEKARAQSTSKHAAVARATTATLPSFVVQIHKRLWRKTYSTITPKDIDGMVLLIHAVAQSSHLADLKATTPKSPSGAKVSYTTDAFSEDIFPQGSPARDIFRNGVKSVNEALKSMRGDFGTLVEAFAGGAINFDHFFDRRGGPSVVIDVIHLMLSPVESLNGAAKSIALNAYDTSERSACYYTLFERFPSEAFRGVRSYLETFNTLAVTLPEACEVSKYLVRSLTEILEGLCDSPSGLLLNPRYGLGLEDPLDKAEDVPKLWTLMTESLAIIFRRVKFWAPYYTNEDMVVWMRDALIFGRDMVAKVQVLQNAATDPALIDGAASSQPFLPSPVKKVVSQVEVNMVIHLQPLLTELIQWLKLTDQETLHQSLELLKTLLECFVSSGTEPPQTTIEALEKVAQREKSTKTQLDDERCRELLQALAPFSQIQATDPIDTSTSIKRQAKKKTVIEISSDEEVVLLGEVKPKVVKSESRKTGKTQASISSFMKEREKKPVTQPSITSFLTGGSKKDDKAASSSSKPKPKQQMVVAVGNWPPSKSSHKPAEKVPTKPKQFEGPSALAIANYRKMQEPKNEGSSSIIKSSRAPSTTGTGSSAPPSSDSSSEESDDEGDRGLLAMTKPETIRIPQATERRQVKMLDPVSRKPAQSRMDRHEEARRETLRLTPDLSPFHRQILHWDYDHQGPEPPGEDLQLSTIPDVFSSGPKAMEMYRRVFQPLILLETWSQLVRSKEETIPQIMCTISSRKHTDNWLDLDVNITEHVPTGWRLGETDIILLRQVDGDKHVLGKIHSSRRVREGINATVRCSIYTENLMHLDNSLSIHSKWRMGRVLNLSTVHREYAALLGLPYYDLFDEILNPKPTILPYVPMGEIENAMESYKVNEPQALAILGSLQTSGFSLIQGPPGTGKTSTICGLVGAFLSTRPSAATRIQAGRASRPEDKEPPKKVLICAPSNAAIDEVAKRLMAGVRKSNGIVTVPNIVRIGAEDSVHSSVKGITLEGLVATRLGKDDAQGSPDLAGIRASLDGIRDNITAKIAEIEAVRGNSARESVLEDDIRKLKIRRQALSAELNVAKDAGEANRRNRDANVRRFRKQILDEADIICSTLSGSGHESLRPLTFETVIIDEAAQSIELSSLIPLKYRCTRCIMVGDPQQLAPTVLSSRAAKFRYDQSLFVRIQKQRPEAVYLLSIQYRMHPDISLLPSKFFYDNRLLNGPAMEKQTIRPWHASPFFRPYNFFNVVEGCEENAHGGHSQINRAEIRVAMALYRRITQEFGAKIDFDGRIGVVTMYRAQLLELKKQFAAQFSQDILRKVDFNTVDGFQGQEKDIIILSCVRAGPNIQSVGFLADTRRMNVALTRSKSSLFILGNAATLERSDAIWRGIVQNARDRLMLVETNDRTFNARTLPTTSKTSTSSLPRVAAAVAPQAAPNASPAVPILAPKVLALQSSKYRGSVDTDGALTTLGTKRPAPEESQPPHDTLKKPETSANGVASRTDPPRSLQPPAKRSKPPPSLFIPKKRPPNPNNSGPNKKPRP